jgi:hypothetical protein
MTAKEFVEMFYNEKNELIKQYFSNSHVTEVGSKIDSLGLTENQMAKMKDVLDAVLTDVMYTTLLGLDGEASIGGVQQTYKLYDENGFELTNSGEIEQYAYEYFHED